MNTKNSSFGSPIGMFYTKAMQLSLTIPCYNEAKNLPLLLEQFAKCIGDRKIEVILVNNGSTDTTAEVLTSLLPQYPFAKTTYVPVNRGYGYGILAGLKASTSPYIGWTHADLQTDPNDCIKAYDMLEKNNWNPALYIKGNRINRPLTDQVFTIGMSVFNTLLFRIPLWEINAQPTIFPRDFFLKWQNPPHDYAIDLYAHLLALKTGLTLKRITVHFPQRKFGVSSWNDGIKGKWLYIKRIVNASFQLKKDLR